MAFFSFFKSKVHFFKHFGPETTTSSWMPCIQNPKPLQIPRNFAHQEPHITEKHESCGFQCSALSDLEVQAAVPRVAWNLDCKGLGTESPNELPETAANPEIPSPMR